MMHPAHEIEEDADKGEILAKVYETLTDPYADSKLDAIAVIEKCLDSGWQRENHAERGS